MSSVYLYNEKKTIQDPQLIRSFLARQGIEFGPFDLSQAAQSAQGKDVLDSTERETILISHENDEQRFKTHQEFRRDLVCFWPTFEHLDHIMSQFAPIHFHYEHEYWYCIDGSASFGYLGLCGEKYQVSLNAGNFLQVPEGRWQWFELTEQKLFKSIRYFFTDQRAPAYTTPLEFITSCPQ